MCLSTQALVLFISMLPQEIVTQSANQIIIAAETGHVTWDSFDGEWCTVAPLKNTSTKTGAD
jgi:hypothetical protein